MLRHSGSIHRQYGIALSPCLWSGLEAPMPPTVVSISARPNASNRSVSGTTQVFRHCGPEFTGDGTDRCSASGTAEGFRRGRYTIVACARGVAMPAERLKGSDVDQIAARSAQTAVVVPAEWFKSSDGQWTLRLPCGLPL